jgi:hypothetical protein
MTTMPAPPLAVDSLLSFARLDGESVRLVLALPDDSGLDAPRLFIRFQNGQTGFRVPASLARSTEGLRVSVSVPREQLTDGVWRLRLREGGSPLRNLNARLLLHGDQPVALLFGKTPNIT